MSGVLGAKALVGSLAEALAQCAAHAHRFDAEDIINNESQLSAALLARLAAAAPEAFEFDPRMGSTPLVANFPFHNYVSGRKGRVRFADYALLDPRRSVAGLSRKDAATHEAEAFVELKYHFVPGAFRGSSPLKDLDRLRDFRTFNETGRRPDGVLGVGFRWTTKTGQRDLDGGATTPKAFSRQERVFRALESRLDGGRDSEWATLVFLDYEEPSAPGVPKVRAFGQHASVAIRRGATANVRTIPVRGPQKSIAHPKSR